MKQTRFVNALAQAVYELSTAPPHEAPGRSYSPWDFRAYSEGYYHALQMVLRVVEITAKREARRAPAKVLRLVKRKAA